MEMITEQTVADAAKTFVAAWNNGDLETACELYADDAVFIVPGKFRRGKATILKQYQESYPARTAMGTLELRLFDFRSPPEARGAMASAIFHWVLYDAGGNITSMGYTLETYMLQDGQLRLMHDASVQAN